MPKKCKTKYCDETIRNSRTYCDTCWCDFKLCKNVITGCTGKVPFDREFWTDLCAYCSLKMYANRRPQKPLFS